MEYRARVLREIKSKIMSQKTKMSKDFGLKNQLDTFMLLQTGVIQNSIHGETKKK